MKVCVRVTHIYYLFKIGMIKNLKIPVVRQYMQLALGTNKIKKNIHKHIPLKSKKSSV